jgi:hypothetical protein
LPKDKVKYLFSPTESGISCNLIARSIVQQLYIYYVQVGEDGKIIDARFKTFGCGSAIGSIAYQDISKSSDVPINQILMRLT